MSTGAIVIDFENHRSRERIKKMGEVFTPDEYVKDMLATLNPKVWTDEDIIFFEPTCGHGNFVIPIFQKRVSSLIKQSTRPGSQKKIEHAIAVALNKLWAIDICPTNIEMTRTRLCEAVLAFLSTSDFNLYQKSARNFMAHVLCTLVWQVHENEALSAIGSKDKGNSTKLGRVWLQKNQYKKIDFDADWINTYRQLDASNAANLLFERALKFLDSLVSDHRKGGYSEFEFAKTSLISIVPFKRMRNSIDVEAV